MSFVVKAVGILQQPTTAALLCYLNLSRHNGTTVRNIATLKDISRRLKLVKSIQKITKSMKMVSAAKFTKAEKELRAARSYGFSAKAFYDNLEVEKAEGPQKHLFIATTSAERWAAFKQHTESIIHSVTSTMRYRKAACTTLVDEIMFEYCYPCLDANVTKGMNHLLKSPFSVHPKTGRLSFPIDPNSLGYFDPCKEDVVPRLDQLCQQVEQLLKQNEDTMNEKATSKQKNYNQTALKPFIDVFARFVQRSQTSKQDKQDEVLAKSDLNTMLSEEI